MKSFDQKTGERADYLRTVFDTIPLATFVVDDDVRIQDFNTTAAQLLGPEPELAIRRRGGDALHCIHSEAHGCGQNKPCQDCVIRNSVKRAIAGGATHRETHKAELRTRTGMVSIDLLITASPLPGVESPRVLLILEDVSELLTLRGLLPICARCKKVRDDGQYWHNIETYLHTHLNLKLTHGLCPDCIEKEIKAIKEYAGPPVSHNHPTP